MHVLCYPVSGILSVAELMLICYMASIHVYANIFDRDDIMVCCIQVLLPLSPVSVVLSVNIVDAADR